MKANWAFRPLQATRRSQHMSSTQESDVVAVERESNESSPVGAKEDYSITITLYQKFGRAFISWRWSNPQGHHYARGEKDLVQLTEGGKWVGNFPTAGGSVSGEVDTLHGWGSKLS